MRSTLRQLAWPIMRGVLPYPDLARRLQVRRAAKALITCKSWPEDDETTGFQIAQLALLRALRLQQETRRLTRGRHHEAAVLVSRSALEVCILGVYCLFAENAVNDLRANNLRTGLTAITALLDPIVPHDLLKEAVNTLGTPRQAPTVRDMVEHIDKTLGGDRMSKLYGLVYGPVSNYFTHAAGSLIRHVRPDNKLSNKPRDPWVRRSPVRLADASVGILAEHVARSESAPADIFARYAQNHLDRILPPLASLAAKRMRTTTGVLPLARTLFHVRQMQSAISQPDLSDKQRQVLARQLYQDMAPLLIGAPDEVLAPIIDHLVKKIVREYAVATRASDEEVQPLNQAAP